MNEIEKRLVALESRVASLKDWKQKYEEEKRKWDQEDERKSKKIEELQRAADATVKLRDTLIQFLGLPSGNTAVDINSVAAEVIRRMPQGVSYTLEPKEFILKDYQRQEVDRILKAVSELTPEQKDLLRFVAGVGRVERREAARAVFAQSPTSFSNRAWADRWNRERLIPVVNTGAAIWDSKHGIIIYSLPDTIKRRLEVYRPTPQEVEQVVVTVEAMFAKEGGSKVSNEITGPGER